MIVCRPSQRRRDQADQDDRCVGNACKAIGNAEVGRNVGRRGLFHGVQVIEPRAPELHWELLFLVFLAFPQGSRIVHSFCTRRELFPVAPRNKVAQSGFIENVRGSWARLMIAAEPAAAGDSRG